MTNLASGLAGSWASWKLRSKDLAYGLRHPLIRTFGPPFPRWGEEGCGNVATLTFSDFVNGTLMMVRADATGTLFSLARRRWPEGSDEGVFFS
ncbi:MAG: Very-short-patch-repair endonuclease [Rhizobium sp.]|nr:Very-short-patch-repair endonuclease [Rhizobium sp.]